MVLIVLEIALINYSLILRQVNSLTIELSILEKTHVFLSINEFQLSITFKYVIFKLPLIIELWS